MESSNTLLPPDLREKPSGPVNSDAASLDNKGSTEKTEKGASSQSKEFSLGDLFAEIEQNYPDLNVPNDTALNKLDEACIRVQKNDDTKTYIVTSVGAAFFFLSFPMLLTWGYEATISLQISLLPFLDQSAYLNSHYGVVVGLALFLFAAVFYPFVIHRDVFHWITERFLAPVKMPIMQINSEGWSFGLFQVLMTYLALAVAIFLIHSLSTTAVQPYTAIAARVWLFLPVIPLSVIPTILLLVIFAIFLREDEGSEAAFMAILRETLLLLRMLKDISDPSQFSMQERRRAINHIQRTAALFRHLSWGENPNSKVGWWTQARMNRIADNFLALSAWVSFPKADSVATLKERLVNYVNVVLSGTFDDFPAKNVDETFPFLPVSRKRGYLKRIWGLVWLLILVTLPLLIYAGVAIATNWSIPIPLQTPALITYSAWVAACLFAHIEELAPEAKTALMDVLKLVFRR